MRNFNKHLKLLFLLMFALYGSSLYAEQLTVTGKVVEDINYEPLAGVSVMVEGTMTGAITDASGNFSLKATEDQTLIFKYLGFDDSRMVVSDVMRTSRVILKEQTQDIEEVVVVGYGVQTKVSSVASISQASGDDLLKGGIVNSVGEALQGQLGGVVTINNTGRPGANNPQIYIRGKASWQNSSPLILVDGVERDFNDIDMNEIETMSVLKDASATAVYGVRGANGVILLTSKQGTQSAPKVNFSANFGLKQPTAKFKWAPYMVSQKLWNEGAYNDDVWTSYIPESTMSAWENAFATGNYGPYNDIFPNVNWYDTMIRDVAYSHNYNLNVRGGSEFMKYFASIGYQYDGDAYRIEKQPKYDPRYFYRRYNWRSNFDFNLTKTTSLYVSISGSMGYQNGGFGDEIFTASLQAPTNLFPIKYSDGEWGEDATEWFNIKANATTRGSQQFKHLKAFYDAKLTQQLDFITKGLSVSASLQYTTSSRTRSNIAVANVLGNNDGLNVRHYSSIRYNRVYDFQNPITLEDGSITYPMKTEVRRNDDQTPEGYPSRANYDALVGHYRRLYYEVAINYARSFGDHNVSGLFVFNRREHDTKGDGNIMNFTEYGEDWVARATYNWRERYLFEANMSYTGTDRLAPSNRFGFFPSVSVGWRPTEEPFMKSVKDVITDMKVRYSWGRTGAHSFPGDMARYPYVQIFETKDNITLGGSSNHNYGPLYYEPYAANPHASWEEATKQNIGLEMTLWHKLRINLELFDEKRDGIFLKPRTVATWVGTDLSHMNIAATKNHGFELDLAWNDKIGKDFRYDVNFTMSASENRVTRRDDPADYPAHKKDAGKPIGWQERYVTVGNYETIDDIFNYSQTEIVAPHVMIPGDLVHIDYNGDGIINSEDNVIVSNLDYPLRIYSLKLGFQWKNFGFSAHIYSPQGVYRNTFDQFFLDFPASIIKAQPNGLSRWTRETANTSGIKRPAVHTQNLRGHNDAASTYKYNNYSYIRLKTVEISYAFPKKILSKLNIDSLRLFLNGNNLLTWSDVDSRVDPETGGPGQYPITRNYTFGLRLSF